jgi:hypothetical protein
MLLNTRKLLSIEREAVQGLVVCICIEDASKMLFKLPSTGESPQTKQLITSGKHAYKIENFEL